MKTKRVMALLALFAVAVLVLAACGGGGSDTTAESTAAETTEAETTGTETTASEEGGETASGEAPVTDPSVPTNKITTPLPKKPPTGLKVIFLQCELPSCERYIPGLTEATDALGWELEPIVFSSSDPAKGLETALSKNPDFITMSGVPQEVIKAQMAKAAKQGVPISSCSTVEQGKPGGYLSQCMSTDVEETEELAKWMNQDSGGKAKIVGLTLPLYPILGTQTGFLENELSGLCAECSYESLDLTSEDIGEGKVGDKVVAYLQGHPETEYVYSTFADIAVGLRQILDSSGFQDVQLVVTSGNEITMPEVGNGVSVTNATPIPYMNWLMIDSLARYSVGEDVSGDKAYQEAQAKIPTYVIDSSAEAERLKQFEYTWPGPGDGAYKQEFEENWHVK